MICLDLEDAVLSGDKQTTRNAINGQDDLGVILVNGRMVDRPMVLAAQRTIQLATAGKK